ncbi:hypothetical protein [Acetatifactor aquisgranensis]|uniref:hypothetical protein n=1 Tax=Acetatifactor aquisgranensis TaxID=2941233 RepID=UPI00203A9E3F|nr:hypothetical protein [Acetatifactor aquisgranensis]
MSKLLKALSNNRREDVRARLAQQDEEIVRLKTKVRKLYVENDDLERENRQLRIRNGELDVAYNSLKEILRKRSARTS